MDLKHPDCPQSRLENLSSGCWLLVVVAVIINEDPIFTGKTFLFWQRPKKVVSESLGLVDLPIVLVNSVLNLPNRRLSFLGEFK